MKSEKVIRLAAVSFIALSALCLASVALMAFVNPQMVMDLVQVTLPNTDAVSSIRGVYGGVGATLVISLVVMLRNNPRQALGFLTLLWGFYALSRTLTIFREGSLGAFGNQWLVTELIFCMVALALYMMYDPEGHHRNPRKSRAGGYSVSR